MRLLASDSSDSKITKTRKRTVQQPEQIHNLPVSISVFILILFFVPVDVELWKFEINNDITRVD